MKIKKFSKKPTDIESRVGADPVVCYPNESINNNLEILHQARKHIKQIDEIHHEIINIHEQIFEIHQTNHRIS